MSIKPDNYYYKRIAFWSCSLITIIALRRNINRMKDYLHNYFDFKHIISNKNIHMASI